MRTDTAVDSPLAAREALALADVATWQADPAACSRSTWAPTH